MVVLHVFISHVSRSHFSCSHVVMLHVFIFQVFIGHAFMVRVSIFEKTATTCEPSEKTFAQLHVHISLNRKTPFRDQKMMRDAPPEAERCSPGRRKCPPGDEEGVKQYPKGKSNDYSSELLEIFEVTLEVILDSQPQPPVLY